MTVPPDILESVQLLGWTGETVGQIDFGGVQFWAVAEIDVREHRRRVASGRGPVVDRDVLEQALVSGLVRASIGPPVRLVGCLLTDRSPRLASRSASLLAGYSRRAILIDDSPAVLGSLIDAAALGQGVVVRSRSGLTRLSEAEPRVPGIGFHAREWELLERVYLARCSMTALAA